jgi:hypothetical protein
MNTDRLKHLNKYIHDIGFEELRDIASSHIRALRQWQECRDAIDAQGRVHGEQLREIQRLNEELATLKRSMSIAAKTPLTTVTINPPRYPFNLARALTGEPVVTRDGRRGKYERENLHVQRFRHYFRIDGLSGLCSYTNDGIYSDLPKHAYDLFMLNPSAPPRMIPLDRGDFELSAWQIKDGEAISLVTVIHDEFIVSGKARNYVDMFNNKSILRRAVGNLAWLPCEKPAPEAA